MVVWEGGGSKGGPRWRYARSGFAILGSASARYRQPSAGVVTVAAVLAHIASRPPVHLLGSVHCAEGSVAGLSRFIRTAGDIEKLFDVFHGGKAFHHRHLVHLAGIMDRLRNVAHRSFVHCPWARLESAACVDFNPEIAVPFRM